MRFVETEVREYTYKFSPLFGYICFFKDGYILSAAILNSGYNIVKFEQITILLRFTIFFGQSKMD